MENNPHITLAFDFLVREAFDRCRRLSRETLEAARKAEGPFRIDDEAPNGVRIHTLDADDKVQLFRDSVIAIDPNALEESWIIDELQALEDAGVISLDGETFKFTVDGLSVRSIHLPLPNSDPAFGYLVETIRTHHESRFDVSGDEGRKYVDWSRENLSRVIVPSKFVDEEGAKIGVGVER